MTDIAVRKRYVKENPNADDEAMELEGNAADSSVKKKPPV